MASGSAPARTPSTTCSASGAASTSSATVSSRRRASTPALRPVSASPSARPRNGAAIGERPTTRAGPSTSRPVVTPIRPVLTASPRTTSRLFVTRGYRVGSFSPPAGASSFRRCVARLHRRSDDRSARLQGSYRPSVAGALARVALRRAGFLAGFSSDAEAPLELGYAAVERVHRAELARQVVEASVDAASHIADHATRGADEPPQRLLALVGESRDDILVFGFLRRRRPLGRRRFLSR